MGTLPLGSSECLGRARWPARTSRSLNSLYTAAPTHHTHTWQRWPTLRDLQRSF